MIPEKTLVLYKSRPAIVAGNEDGKISISVQKGELLKVREKDIEVLHPGPCALSDLEVEAPAGDPREAWELLTDTVSPDAAVPLRELVELVYGSFTPRTAWAAWELFQEGLYFIWDAGKARARPPAEVEEREKKRDEKQRETGERAAFLERLKRVLSSGTAGKGDLPERDRRFLQDVEALARGQSDRSRTLRELGRPETPQEAHRLLLSAGVWTVWENPHPGRLGLSPGSAKILPGPAREEERLDFTGLAAYAIDNPWSDDPDDAVSLEGPGQDGRYTLYVHVADPAAAVLPGSPADIEARGRGATLYLPEGASRMLAPEVLPRFALGTGPGGFSLALSFKMILNRDLSIAETEIAPSRVRVTRLSYGEADALIEGPDASADAALLAALFNLAEQNTERRLDTGAVLIELPEAHISVRLGEDCSANQVTVEPLGSFKSTDMVRECMLLAGEGAARWALRNKLPFPFISQEAGDLPDQQDRLPGLAGAWQMRRCMRPRSLSARPGIHWGLGLDEYTQVTSPLRRYTDLLCHQQIRALLRGEAPLGEEEVLLRVSAAEAAAAAASRAERASRAHWIAVYLSDKKDSVWDGVILDRKGNRGVVSIPALGLETQVSLKSGVGPNDAVRLICGQVNIPEGEAAFVCA
ncbi:MAG: RNB domain-containing ribonuclease [Treponema sp.]|nr:RNB domain-containing ribonuclease [Treponema sp.]